MQVFIFVEGVFGRWSRWDRYEIDEVGWIVKTRRLHLQFSGVRFSRWYLHNIFESQRFWSMFRMVRISIHFLWLKFALVARWASCGCAVDLDLQRWLAPSFSLCWCSQLQLSSSVSWAVPSSQLLRWSTAARCTTPRVPWWLLASLPPLSLNPLGPCASRRTTRASTCGSSRCSPCPCSPSPGPSSTSGEWPSGRPCAWLWGDCSFKGFCLLGGVWWKLETLKNEGLLPANLCPCLVPASQMCYGTFRWFELARATRATRSESCGQRDFCVGLFKLSVEPIATEKGGCCLVGFVQLLAYSVGPLGNWSIFLVVQNLRIPKLLFWVDYHPIVYCNP